MIGTILDRLQEIEAAAKVSPSGSVVNYGKRSSRVLPQGTQSLGEEGANGPAEKESREVPASEPIISLASLRGSSVRESIGAEPSSGVAASKRIHSKSPAL